MIISRVSYIITARNLGEVKLDDGRERRTVAFSTTGTCSIGDCQLIDNNKKPASGVARVHKETRSLLVLLDGGGWGTLMRPYSVQLAQRPLHASLALDTEG